MITATWFSPAADEAAARYGLVVQAWQSMFAQAAVRSDLGSARSFTTLQLDAYALVQRHLSREREEIRETLEDVAKAAQGAASLALGADVPAELTDAVSEAVSASYEHLSHELIVQAERDVAFMVKSLRQHALQVSIASRAKRIPLAAAVMQARIGSGTHLNFVVGDRGGTKWPSRKFVRTLVRHALVLLYNDVVLLTLADHGIEQAEIRHASPRAEMNGRIVAVSPDSEHPTYAEIRAEVFHPNADAILVPVGAA